MTDEYQEFIKKSREIMGQDYLPGSPCPFCGQIDVEELAKYTTGDRHVCASKKILFWTEGILFRPPYGISYKIFRAELHRPVSNKEGTQFDGLTVTQNKDGSIVNAMANWGLNCD
jgi:hypothetical protein